MAIAHAADYHAVAGAHVEMLPGLGHSPNLEDPPRTATPLLAFTATLGAQIDRMTLVSPTARPRRGRGALGLEQLADLRERLARTGSRRHCPERIGRTARRRLSRRAAGVLVHRVRLARGRGSDSTSSLSSWSRSTAARCTSCTPREWGHARCRCCFSHGWRVRSTRQPRSSDR